MDKALWMSFVNSNFCWVLLSILFLLLAENILGLAKFTFICKQNDVLEVKKGEMFCEGLESESYWLRKKLAHVYIVIFFHSA